MGTDTLSMDQVVDIKARQVDSCVVLDIEAENFTYPQTSILKTYVMQLLESGECRFVLNVEKIGIIDSYGLATIVSVLKLIQDAHGGMALYGLNEIFTRLVKLTQLNTILEIWPNESQAIYYLCTHHKTPAKS